jgi:predicted signal transduction protein with EAL and GGDEF domain
MLYYKIQDCLLEYIESINYEVYFTLSEGIIDFKINPTAHYNEMMKWSEYALSLSKKRGKNNHTHYQKDYYEKFQREVQLTKILRQAVINHFSGFEVHFHPLLVLKQKRCRPWKSIVRRIYSYS